MTRERTSSTSEPASLEVLHQNVHLPKQVAQLALHRLPLQQERPDREQLIVAGHTLAVPFFSGNVDSHTRRCRNVCLDDRTEIFEDNPQTGTPGRHVPVQTGISLVHSYRILSPDKTTHKQERV